MNTFTKSLFLAFAILLFGAASAMAYTVTFGDSTIYFPGHPSTVASENTNDVIGVPDITGGSATFETSGGTTYLTSVTLNITVSKYYNEYNTLVTGDLFVNADGADNDWEYVVTQGDGATIAAGVYEFGYAYGDKDVYNYSYYPSAGDIRNNHPVTADTADLGALVDNSIVFPDLPSADASVGGTQTLTLTISGLMIEVGDYVTLGYTVSCANDVILERISTTPIPGAVWLLGTGLLGLVGLRSRFRG